MARDFARRAALGVWFLGVGAACGDVVAPLPSLGASSAGMPSASFGGSAIARGAGAPSADGPNALERGDGAGGAPGGFGAASGGALSAEECQAEPVSIAEITSGAAREGSTVSVSGVRAASQKYLVS